MNSLILSWISTCFVYIRDNLSKSAAGRLFNKIYRAVSSAFSKSFVNKSFDKKRELLEESLFHRICHFPFFIIECFEKLFHNILKSFWDKSYISDLAKSYYNNFMSLNFKFLGSCIIGFSFLRIACGGGILIPCIMMVAGLVIACTKISLSDFISGSAIVRFLLGCFDFNTEFKFYEKESNGKKSIIIGLITGAVAGAAYFKLSLLGLLLPVGLLGMLIVLKYPIVGVVAAVFGATLVPTMVLAAICIFTFIVLFVKKSVNGDYEWKSTGVGTLLIILLGVFFVSNIFSFDVKKSLMVWAMYAVFFSFYFVIINTVKTKKEFYNLLKFFVLSGIIVAVYGILQYIFKWNTNNAWIDKEMFEEATMRAYSTMENPNVLGEYLLLLLPVAGVFMLTGDVRKLSKWVYMGVFLASALCLVFTQSRGCWLGFILSVAIFVTFYKGKLWALIPFAFMALPFVLPETMVDRMLSIGDMSDSSTSYRVYIWYGTMEMLKTFAIGGIGMGEGAFRTVYPFYSYDAIIAPHSHNLYLQFVVEAGIGALLLLIGLVISFMRNCIMVCKKSMKNSLDYLTSLALVSGVAGFLLQSMFDYTFYNYRMMAIFIMYLSFGAVLKELVTKSIKGAEKSEKDN